MIRRHSARWFISAVAAITLVTLPAGAVLPPGGTFIDDDGSVHESDIEAISAAGITRGCNPPWNDEFCPTRAVSRGEMAAFLVRALGLEPGPERFVDDTFSVFQADINALAAAGITRGCNPPANDRFCPDRPVTRGEMAAFLTRAYGYEATTTDRFLDDDDSVFESDIDALASSGVTRGCDPPANQNFCPDDLVTRQQMASFLTRAEDLPTEAVPSRPDVRLNVVASGFAQPVYAVAPPGDDRLFVVEKGGVIRIVEDGQILPEPFLDISSEVANRGEMGLLSMAFHPEFPADDRVFVYYSNEDDGHESRISSFRLSSDPDVLSPAETRVMTIDQPDTNHNGGHLLFGPGGYMIIALGDGGGGNDRYGNAQNANTVLGSLLRIDVDGASPYSIPADNPFLSGPGRDEIWALGLRNPWRIWFDGGLLFVADVGQGAREEITVVADDRPLVNYGWPRFEGSLCNPNDTDPSCSTAGLEFPDVEYDRADGACAITGGLVYRGEALPWLQGHYFYGDLCAGFIRSFRTHDGNAVDDAQDWTGRLGEVPGFWSFGADGAGELLIVSGSAGTVYRLEAD
jgi:hypothetical protein